MQRLSPAKRFQASSQNPDDDHVLSCALAARADILVTQDKHLLKLKTSVRIVTPKKFIELF